MRKPTCNDNFVNYQLKRLKIINSHENNCKFYFFENQKTMIPAKKRGGGGGSKAMKYRYISKKAALFGLLVVY